MVTIQRSALATRRRNRDGSIRVVQEQWRSALVVAGVVLVVVAALTGGFFFVTLGRRYLHRGPSEQIQRPVITHNTESCRPKRILWGIFTVLGGEKDRYHRQVIRETYLSYYRNRVRQNQNRENDDDPRDSKPDAYRVCSLQQLLSISQHEQDRSQKDEWLLRHCRLVYTFVVGGNPHTNRTEFVASTRFADEGSSSPSSPLSSSPLTDLVMDPTTIAMKTDLREDVEDDLMFLNIRENMDLGKTPTWFYFASELIQAHKKARRRRQQQQQQQQELHTTTTSIQLAVSLPMDFEPIDYIAKVDMDTIPYFDKLLGYVDCYFPHHNEHQPVYGGKMKYATIGNPPQPQFLGAAGEFYLLNPDLAAYVSSDHPHAISARDQTRGGYEDVSLWKVLATHPMMTSSSTANNLQLEDIGKESRKKGTVTAVLEKHQGRYWSHQQKWKDPDAYRQQWHKVCEVEKKCEFNYK